MTKSPPPSFLFKAVAIPLSLLLLIIAFYPNLASLIAAWKTEEYSHGYFIPVLAFFMGWHRLAEKPPHIAPSRAGLWVLILAATLLLVGRLSAFEPPSQYGFLLALAGLSLATLGREATKTLAPAFIYLLFAIPLPRLIYVALSQDMQLLSSTIGVFILDAMGISVYQEGNVIDLGGAKLQVVEACSGLRYLFPLMSFGFLGAYLLDDKMWKRGIVFLSTIPITILMNSLRIAVIGITVNFWGSGMAEGLLHDFEGWGVFLLCIVVLMGEISILLHIGTPGHFRYEYLGLPQNKRALGPLSITSTSFGSVGVTFLLALIFGTSLIEERSEIVPKHPPLSSFPLAVGEWRGQQDELPYDLVKALALSDYWMAHYAVEQGTPAVELYIAYYDSQRIQSAIHSPANCIPGNGWEVGQHSTSILTLPEGSSLKVSRLVIRRAEEAQLVYYWFDERGRNLTEQYGAKWYLLWDSVVMHRTDGALVRLVTKLNHGENEMAADKRMFDFITNARPIIKQFIPGRTAQTEP